jgi:hypothetical protein
MVRAVFKKGQIQPLDTFPESWKEGQELLIEEADTAVDPEELAAWSREIEEAAERIPEEEHKRFWTALEEIERESKEEARKEMGLA